MHWMQNCGDKAWAQFPGDGMTCTSFFRRGKQSNYLFPTFREKCWLTLPPILGIKWQLSLLSFRIKHNFMNYIKSLYRSYCCHTQIRVCHYIRIWQCPSVRQYEIANLSAWLFPFLSNTFGRLILWVQSLKLGTIYWNDKSNWSTIVNNLWTDPKSVLSAWIWRDDIRSYFDNWHVNWWPFDRISDFPRLGALFYSLARDH
jgi:hypothetical protein